MLRIEFILFRTFVSIILLRALGDKACSPCLLPFCSLHRWYTVAWKAYRSKNKLYLGREEVRILIICPQSVVYSAPRNVDMSFLQTAPNVRQPKKDDFMCPLHRRRDCIRCETPNFSFSSCLQLLIGCE